MPETIRSRGGKGKHPPKGREGLLGILGGDYSIIRKAIQAETDKKTNLRRSAINLKPRIRPLNPLPQASGPRCFLSLSTFLSLVGSVSLSPSSSSSSSSPSFSLFSPTHPHPPYHSFIHSLFTASSLQSPLCPPWLCPPRLHRLTCIDFVSPHYRTTVCLPRVVNRLGLLFISRHPVPPLSGTRSFILVNALRFLRFIRAKR